MSINLKTKRNVKIALTSPWMPLLGIVFVILKSFSVGPIADWSWWLVLLPFYLSFVVVLGVIAFVLALYAAIFGVGLCMFGFEAIVKYFKKK